MGGDPMFYLCFCYNAHRFVDFMSVLQTRAACMLQKMCNSAPCGHTFRWVSEFGVTPARASIIPAPRQFIERGDASNHTALSIMTSCGITR
jgi:hypothetical protein